MIETAISPKERPIIFTSESVREIMEGTKTQTRRVMKPQPEVKSARVWFNENMGEFDFRRCSPWFSVSCPYGKPGDLLWVKEAFAKGIKGCPNGVTYRADHVDQRGDGPANTIRWRSPLFMARWASRITLEIVNVRVERAQEITYEDALAEGAADFGLFCEHHEPGKLNHAGETAEQTARRLAWPQRHFAELWDSINGKKHPWDTNPWVWVIEFKGREAT